MAGTVQRYHNIFFSYTDTSKQVGIQCGQIKIPLFFLYHSISVGQLRERRSELLPNGIEKIPLDLKAAENFKSDRVASTMTVS